MNKKLADIFFSTPKLSIKNNTYFDIYEFIFNSYRGEAITFIEVGVFNVGSLHMWRSTLEKKRGLLVLILILSL